MFRTLALVALVFGVVGASLVPSSAHAQTTLATAFPAVLGQGRYISVAASSQYYLRYQLQANRSYFAVCWNLTTTTQITTCGVDIRNGSDVGVGSGLNVEPFDNGFTVFGGDGDSYQPTTSGSYYVRISNSAVTSVTMNVMVIENTMFSPWWYVAPSSGYDSWTQIRNNTGQAIPVTIRAYTAAGTIAGSSTQNIPANGTVLVQVSTLVPSGGAGSMSIAYDGPPGSIAANTTTLSGATGLSFDSPFTPRMNWSSFGFLQ